MKGLIDLRVAAGLRSLPDLTGHTKLEAYVTWLQVNNLTKEELTQKLPKQLVKNKAWLKQTIDLQEYNVKKMKKALKLTSPKKMTGITSKTKIITGKVDKNTWVKLCRPHSDHMQGWGLGHQRYYKNSYYKNSMLIETLTFKLKK